MSAHRTLRVVIDARSHASTGGVQQFTLGLLHGLLHLEPSDETYLALSNADSRGWLAGLGDRLDLIDARLPVTRRGAVGRFRSVLLSHAPGLRRLKRAMPARGRRSDLPVTDGVAEAAGADVIHFVRQMAFLTDVPSIYHPWDLQHVHLPEFFTPEERRLRDHAYRTFSERAARVVVATSWGKADLVNAYAIAPERIAVVPVAQDPLAYPTPTPSDVDAVRGRYGLPQRFLVYPAQTWPHKNHVRLLEALAILRDSARERVQLVLTGHHNEHYSSIRAAIERLRLVEQVKPIGYVSALELQAIYRCARGMVFPSLFEGWGIPVVEAFAVDLPVACSTATSLPALVGDAALLFDPTDPEAIAASVLTLWADDQGGADLVRKGRRRLAAFDPQRVASTYRALYRSVSGRRLTDEDWAVLESEPPV